MDAIAPAFHPVGKLINRPKAQQFPKLGRPPDGVLWMVQVAVDQPNFPQTLVGGLVGQVKAGDRPL
jgi:hypothetical protein